MVCTCEPNQRWYIPGSLRHPTPEMEEYVHTRLHLAIKDPLTLSMDYLKEQVKDLPPMNLVESRLFLGQHHPFKEYECRCPSRCCGSCSKKCMTRCVQDLLQRLYFESIWGNSTIKNLIKYVLAQENTGYVELCSVYNQCLYEHKLRKEIIDAYDYGCTCKIDDKGLPLVDDSSGRIMVLPWPESGMCPFCLNPKELKVYSKRNGPRGYSWTRSTDLQSRPKRATKSSST